MDHQRFDNLTRTLATGVSRRSLLGGLVGGATLFGLGGRGAFAKEGKTTICHQTDSGFNVITVANPALDAHYGHGDFAYTDCCTDGECATGSICAAGSCTPVCTDDQCPDDQACQNDACTPLSCPPYLAPINHACQHPCSTKRCICDDGDLGNCVANHAGEAVCTPGSGAAFGIASCVSDAECEAASGNPDDFEWVCVHGPGGDSVQICQGNIVYCPNWTPGPE